MNEIPDGFISMAELIGDPGSEAPPPNGPDDYGVEAIVKQANCPVVKIVIASSFAGVEVPKRSWHVDGLIPNRAVTILGGDGDTGKSLLGLQLGVATVAGKDWIGTFPVCGPAIYLSAEDDLDEIHRRLADIANGQDIDFKDLDGLHIIPLAGEDAVLGSPNLRTGLIAETPLFQAIRAHVARVRPRLLVLDNLADVFAGNEISRPEARQFIGLLRKLAIEFDLAVLLLGHPSLSGMASGTGTSGSTGWNNSVRSRLYFERRKDGEDKEPDPDLRVLTLKKGNYARRGREIGLRWVAGRFVLDEPVSGFNKLAADAKADETFLNLVARFEREGRDVSPNPSATFAPKVFAEQPDADGMTAKALRAAMDRMFAAKRVKIDTTGPASRRRSRIILRTDEG